MAISKCLCCDREVHTDQIAQDHLAWAAVCTVCWLDYHVMFKFI